MKSGAYGRSGRSPCAMHRSPEDDTGHGSSKTCPEQMLANDQSSDHGDQDRDDEQSASAGRPVFGTHVHEIEHCVFSCQMWARWYPRISIPASGYTISIFFGKYHTLYGKPFKRLFNLYFCIALSTVQSDFGKRKRALFSQKFHNHTTEFSSRSFELTLLCIMFTPSAWILIYFLQQCAVIHECVVPVPRVFPIKRLFNVGQQFFVMDICLVAKKFVYKHTPYIGFNKNTRIIVCKRSD